MKSAVAIPLVLLLGFALGLALDRLAFARRLGLAAVVLSLLYIVDLNIAFVPSYRGMTRGFDLGTADVMMAALAFFTLLQAPRTGWRWFAKAYPRDGVPVVSPVVVLPPGLFALLLFAFWALLTVLASRIPLFGWMDWAKLVRGILLCWLVVQLVRDDRVADRIPLFLLLYVAVEAAVCGVQYAQGFWWIPGTFEHKNSFALATNMVLPVILAQALLGPRRTLPLYLGAWGVGAVCIILSRSRMGWFTMALSAGLVGVASVWIAARRRDGAQLRAQFLAFLAVALLALPALLVMADGIISRLGEDRAASLDFRVRNNIIATTLADRHLLGVGLNNYVAELREPIGAILPAIDKTVAHHLYNLIAAETGWAGLGLFVLSMVSLWGIGLYTLIGARRLSSRIATLGLLVGFLTAHLHSFLESDLLRRETWYIFGMLAGMLIGVHQREGLAGWTGGLRRLVRAVAGARSEPWLPSGGVPRIRQPRLPAPVIEDAEPLPLLTDGSSHPATEPP